MINTTHFVVKNIMNDKELNDLVLRTYTIVNELKVQMMPQKNIVAPDWVNREQLTAFLR